MVRQVAGTVKSLFAVVLIPLAWPASATTITEGGPGAGTALELRLDEFTKGAGACGSGLSLVNDGCAPVYGPKEKPFGRFSPTGGHWVDSADMPHLTWNVDLGTEARSFTFAITDPWDQPDKRAEGPSHFEVAVDDAVWKIISRQKNGGMHWLTVRFEKATRLASLVFSTGQNDGFGVSDVSVCVKH